MSKLLKYRETLMNTPKMTFFKLDWANKKAQNYICNFCKLCILTNTILSSYLVKNHIFRETNL